VTRLLLDVNVVLDFLLDREPFAEAAGRLWANAERRRVEAFVPAHGVTTVFYVTARQRDARFARRVLQDVLSVAAVAAVDDAVLRRALASPCPDFEDAVCLAAAEAAGCAMLVTRDPAGYRGAALPILDPGAAVALFSGEPPDAVEERSRPRRPPAKAGAAPPIRRRRR
jgi:predicted nucleic acid-binding protein